MRKRVGRWTRAATFAGLRAGFVVGEKVSPELASRAAERLWFSVPTPPPFARRNRGLDLGELGQVDVHGTPVTTHSWGEGPVVLLVHGWSGWYQQFGLYVAPLVAAGFRVVTWDAPSHGESPPGRYGPGRSGIPDLTDALLAVGRASGDGVHGVVAHSGGAMAAVQAMTSGLRVERAVLLAASVDAQDVLSLLRRRMSWGDRTVGILIGRMERIQRIRLDDFDMVAATQGHPDHLPPALLLHDVGDDETPPEGSRRLASVWPGAVVEETVGLGHHHILWAPRTIEHTVAFLAG